MLSGGDIYMEWEAGITGRIEKRWIICFFERKNKKNELFKSVSDEDTAEWPQADSNKKFTDFNPHVPEAKQWAVRRVTNEKILLQQLLTKAKHLQCHDSLGRAF